LVSDRAKVPSGRNKKTYRKTNHILIHQLSKPKVAISSISSISSLDFSSWRLISKEITLDSKRNKKIIKATKY